MKQSYTFKQTGVQVSLNHGKYRCTASVHPSRHWSRCTTCWPGVVTAVLNILTVFQFKKKKKKPTHWFTFNIF